jgi:starch phosphorylase
MLNKLELPQDLRPLEQLAENLYWNWNRKIRSVFEYMDPAAWEGLGHNPILLLNRISKSRLDILASDRNFKSILAEAYDVQRKYFDRKDTWFEKNYGPLAQGSLIAYFSAEFGFAECFKIYSGGLGILAGDHLKSASDNGIPLVGIGLFYKRGYFSQSVDQSGWQLESYPENNPQELPCKPVLEKDSHEPLIISIPLDERQVRIRAWKVSIGRISLYLLDSNVPGLNSKHDCEITAELYGGDHDTRIKQEIILGFGGAKLLHALGISPTIFHMNEGHAAFVTLERIRELVEEKSVSFSEAMRTTKSSNIFTTHTPVPAGIDVFHSDAIIKYLSWYCKRTGISHHELLDLGREKDSHGFNMAILAIRLSRDVNAVSKLHTEVATKLWGHIFGQESAKKEHEIAIQCVTNGIHVPSWISDSMAEIYEKYLGRNWIERTSDEEMWKGVGNVPEKVLWNARSRARVKLVEFIRSHYSFPNYEANSILDPKSLTIGFARRFATYKRANLILHSRERLTNLLHDSSRPVQFVFAGKAHPRDHEAKLLIQQIIDFAKSEAAGGKVVFLPDYDISLARRLVSGVDLWLNTPRRPHEACGTSGMKAIPNGVLNFSTLDGWWAEAYTPECGWTIGTGSELHSHHDQDRVDSDSMYKVLENEIIPEFYERENGIPSKWVERMKNSISTLSPRFSTNRMLVEYSRKFYFKELESLSLNRGEFGIELLEHYSPRWEI